RPRGRPRRPGLVVALLSAPLRHRAHLPLPETDTRADPTPAAHPRTGRPLGVAADRRIRPATAGPRAGRRPTPPLGTAAARRPTHPRPGPARVSPDPPRSRRSPPSAETPPPRGAENNPQVKEQNLFLGELRALLLTDEGPT